MYSFSAQISKNSGLLRTHGSSLFLRWLQEPFADDIPDICATFTFVSSKWAYAFGRPPIEQRKQIAVTVCALVNQETYYQYLIAHFSCSAQGHKTLPRFSQDHVRSYQDLTWPNSDLIKIFPNFILLKAITKTQRARKTLGQHFIKTNPFLFQSNEQLIPLWNWKQGHYYCTLFLSKIKSQYTFCFISIFLIFVIPNFSSQEKLSLILI